MPQCLLVNLLIIAMSMFVIGTEALAQTAEPTRIDESELEPRPHIRLRTEADVVVRRDALLRHIWGQQPDLNRLRPTRISKSGAVRWASSLSRNAEVWEITQTMAHGVETTAYYVARPTPRRCLMVLVQGHLPEFQPRSPSTSLVQRLLDGGCDLILHAMPLLGGNSQPVVDTPSFGRIKLASHNALMFLESDTFSPMVYFFEPVAAALNAVLGERPYPFVGMAGLSGGGWTTTVYSALDTRIQMAVAIAGSWPIPLRVQNAESFGDWEQTAPRFYAHASFADLYLMAGHYRRHIELVHIENDPCCFNGKRLTSYREPILRQAAALNSSVAFTVVPGRRHEINSAAADRLTGLVGARTGLSFPSATSMTADLCRAGDVLVRRSLAAPFASVGGLAWLVALPDLAGEASSMAEPERSRLVLCENGRPIGHSNQLHDSIRKEGEGLFSHWMEWIVLSTSDNSDPNTNGRSYSVVIPR